MSSRARIFAWLMSGLVIVPVVGLAEDDKKQEQAVKPDLPGAFHQRLGDLAGPWDVSTRYVIGDKTHEGKATCEAKMILDGRFLQQDYSSLFQGREFHVLQLWGYDNIKKKSIEIMMDTMGTGVLHNEGTVSDDGKVITNLGESRDPQTGKPYKLRTVTTIVDNDNFVTEWFGTEEGRKEAKVVTLTHKRKK
jgi:uncharacterized protein DUF1579